MYCPHHRYRYRSENFKASQVMLSPSVSHFDLRLRRAERTGPQTKEFLQTASVWICWVRCFSSGCCCLSSLVYQNRRVATTHAPNRSPDVSRPTRLHEGDFVHWVLACEGVTRRVHGRTISCAGELTLIPNSIPYTVPM